MKIKANRRLIIGMTLLMIIASGIVLLLYNEMDKRTTKEETKTVLVFERDLDMNTVLQKKDIKYEEYPISLIPQGAAEEIQDVVGKTLSSNGFEETVVLRAMLTERGELKGNTDNLWILSLKVDELSNFIGLQIKKNESYYLNHLTEEDYIELSDDLKVIELVDAYGNKVVGERQEYIETIVIGVKSKYEHDAINQAKSEGKFILTRAPLNYREVKLKQENIYNFYSELLKEKQKGGDANGTKVN